MIRLLLIEDDADDADLLLRGLDLSGFQVAHRRIETEEEMRSALQADVWDAIVCDVSLPSFDAWSALRVCVELGVDSPFVMVSGVVGEEIAADAMRAGAHDFILKANLARLAPTLRRELKRCQGRCDRGAALAALQESERRHRAFFEQTAIGIAYVAPDQTWLRANARLWEIVGVDPCCIMEVTFNSLVQTEYRATEELCRTRLLEGDETSTAAELRIERDDRELAWIKLTWSLVCDESGSPSHFVAIVEDITSRKRADEELRRSETQFRLVTDGMAAMIAYVGIDRRCRFVNRRCEEFYNIPREDIVGKDFLELVGQQDHGAELAHYVDAAMSGRSVQFDTSFTLGGITGSILCRLVPDFDEAGIVRGVFAVNTDQFEIKRVQQELLASRSRLEDALRVARLGSWELDARTGAGFFSAQARAILGISGRRVGSPVQAFAELLDATDSVPWLNAVAAALDYGAAVDMDLRITRDDGERRVISATIRTECTESGEVVKILGTWQDVTDHKRVEDALRESEARVSATVRATADAIVTIDPKDVIQSFNPVAQRIFGHRADEVLGRNVSILMDDTYASRHEREVLGRHKDGTVFPAAARVSETKLDGPVAYVGLLQDISKRGKAETQRADVERRVHHVERLEALGTLARGVAHDFNNILSPILAYTHLLESADLSQTEHSEMVVGIRRATVRAKRLVRQILDFGRPEGGRNAPVVVDSVVREVVDLLRATVPSTIRIELANSSQGARIYGDATQLHRLLFNLCVNSAQSMEQSSGLLRISVASEKVLESRTLSTGTIVRGRYVVVVIADTGPGISPEAVPLIFDPFFTTKPVNEGAGLGLAIVHGLAKTLGGAVDVDSEPGSGTSFTVVLPELLEQQVILRGAERSVGGKRAEDDASR